MNRLLSVAFYSFQLSVPPSDLRHLFREDRDSGGYGSEIPRDEGLWMGRINKGTLCAAFAVFKFDFIVTVKSENNSS